MSEIRGDDGKLIATIHDTEGFIEWLDKYERLLRAYSLFRPPWRITLRFNLMVDQNTVDNAKEAAKQLEAMRLQFGDIRDDLYPTELPPQH